VSGAAGEVSRRSATEWGGLRAAECKDLLEWVEASLKHRDSRGWAMFLLN
jgi:hypothetical protein